MRRRTLLRRVGAASVLTASGAGLASGEQRAYIDWEFDDGTTERIELREFDRRSDTPAIDTIDLRQAEPTCCAWSDNPGCRDCDYDFETV